IDFTPSRVPEGRRGEVVRELMAHHEGMTLVSLANYLLDDRMQERFHADPMVQATEVLLQERNPRDVPVAYPHVREVLAARNVERAVGGGPRRYNTPHTSTPRVQLLSNGRYSLMLTNAGGGYSLWNDLTVTRWRTDATRDCWGTFFYLRDLRTREVWSAA